MFTKCNFHKYWEWPSLMGFNDKNYDDKLITIQRNWVFATNSNFQIPISLQPNGLNLFISNYLTQFIVKYITRSAPVGFNEIEIKKSELGAKTQFSIFFDL